MSEQIASVQPAWFTSNESFRGREQMRLRYQPGDNSLRLTLDREPVQSGRRVTVAGYVDVGEGGRLVGVEPVAGTDLDLKVALAPWRADPVAADYISLNGDAVYIELSAPEEASIREHQRTVEASLSVELDESGHMVALFIPRRGAGYEISYPSGNQ